MQATFRFYAELNDFLPHERRGVRFTCSFYLSAPVKDLIEGFGVPHPEVELILANGASVDFSYRVSDGDSISVYPVFESIDVKSLIRVRPEPLRVTRFVADTHLGRLAGYLRLTGFDTLYRNDYADDELARISCEERRILLTRDRGLLMRGSVTHGYYLRETSPRKQLAEVLRRFDLFRVAAPFRRCLTCNGVLEAADPGTVEELVPAAIGARHAEFQRCDSCGKVFWRGTHYQRMQEFLSMILKG